MLRSATDNSLVLIDDLGLSKLDLRHVILNVSRIFVIILHGRYPIPLVNLFSNPKLFFGFRFLLIFNLI